MPLPAVNAAAIAGSSGFSYNSRIYSWRIDMSAVLAAPTLLDRYSAEFAGSRRRFEEAKRIFPDGVTHDLRFLEPFPIYVDRQKGSRKWDIDGHEFIDYWSGHGSMLLGHSHPNVVAAVQKQVEK